MATWTMDVIASTGYVGLVFLMCVENLFPPIPSEVIMPLAGYMASRGRLSLAGVIVAGVTGSVAGALPLYYLGTRVTQDRLNRFADRHGCWLTVSREDLESAGRWFDRRGGAAVFFCRLLPGVRSLISIPAGVRRMNLAAFLAWTILGSAAWTALLAYVGFFLGSNFRAVEKWLDPLSWVVFGVILVAYVTRVIRIRYAASHPC